MTHLPAVVVEPDGVQRAAARRQQAARGVDPVLHTHGAKVNINILVFPYVLYEGPFESQYLLLPYICMGVRLEVNHTGDE